MRHSRNIGVGDHIAAARKRAAMTQEELAGRLHVTRQTISNYESMRSQPDIQMLMRLADCLHVSAEELIYGTRPSAGRSTPGFWGGFCKALGAVVYIAGAICGIQSGSGAVPVGDNMVGWGFALENALPVWAGALICGTVLLTLSRILFLLEQREEDGAGTGD